METIHQPSHYYIYRLKNTIPDYTFICYQAYNDLPGRQNQINEKSYDLILQGVLQENETPADLYNRIHKNQHQGDKQIYLRASDVFVFNYRGNLQAYYLDPIGFTKLQNFFAHNCLSFSV